MYRSIEIRRAQLEHGMSIPVRYVDGHGGRESLQKAPKIPRSMIQDDVGPATRATWRPRQRRRR